MLRLPCPKCRKASYTPDVESFNACPYCGLVFSGKYGSDRRRETRIEREIPFSLSCKGRDFEASTTDLSEGGVGIRIFGDPLLEIGDTVKVTIRDLSIVARVMWVKKLPDRAWAGLARLN